MKYSITGAEVRHLVAKHLTRTGLYGRIRADQLMPIMRQHAIVPQSGIESQTFDGFEFTDDPPATEPALGPSPAPETQP